MIKLSNPNIIKKITLLIILLVLAKSISLAFWWFLPSEGVNLQEQTNYKPKYQRVDFKNMVKRANTSHKPVKEEQKISSSGMSITSMILKGLYGSGSHGVAIVASKSSQKKTSIVSVGEEFSGYILKTILKDGVVFTKQGKQYILKMLVNKSSENISKSFIRSVPHAQNEKTVARKDIKYYSSNPDKIWKDISIVQLKNKQGFEITGVRKDSKMADLGLQKGDIMIRANNNDLKSYKDAIDLYKEIDKIKTIQLVVLRNNEEKEFIYEIN